MRVNLLKIWATEKESISGQGKQEVVVLSLRRLWQALCVFMLDKSKQDVVPKNVDYGKKVRFYPYLSELDESRDWLEVIFNLPNPRR